MTIEMISAITKAEDQLNQLRRMLHSQIPCGNAIWYDSKHPVHKALADAKAALAKLADELDRVE